jgi:hypothetical protein
MELDNIILGEVTRLRITKINLGLMIRGDYIQEVWGKVRNPKHESV